MFEVGHNLAIKVLTALSQTTASPFSYHHLLDLFSAQRCSGGGSRLAHFVTATAIKVPGRPHFSLAQSIDQCIGADFPHLLFQPARDENRWQCKLLLTVIEKSGGPFLRSPEFTEFETPRRQGLTFFPFLCVHLDWPVMAAVLRRVLRPALISERKINNLISNR